MFFPFPSAWDTNIQSRIKCSILCIFWERLFMKSFLIACKTNKQTKTMIQRVSRWILSTVNGFFSFFHLKTTWFFVVIWSNVGNHNISFHKRKKTTFYSLNCDHYLWLCQKLRTKFQKIQTQQPKQFSFIFSPQFNLTHF